MEWIDSASNPADGLSRDGLADTWTVSQGWQLQLAILPQWDDIRLGLARFVKAIKGETLGFASNRRQDIGGLLSPADPAPEGEAVAFIAQSSHGSRS